MATAAEMEDRHVCLRQCMLRHHATDAEDEDEEHVQRDVDGHGERGPGRSRRPCSSDQAAVGGARCSRSDQRRRGGRRGCVRLERKGRRQGGRERECLRERVDWRACGSVDKNFLEGIRGMSEIGRAHV